MLLPLSQFSVTFKTFYTQRAEEAYNSELISGVSFKESNGSFVPDGIKPDAIERANKAALRILIDEIRKGDSIVPLSEDWMLDLPRADYVLLTEELARIQGAEAAAREAGKKNDRAINNGTATGTGAGSQ